MSPCNYDKVANIAHNGRDALASIYAKRSLHPHGVYSSPSASSFDPRNCGSGFINRVGQITHQEGESEFSLFRPFEGKQKLQKKATAAGNIPEENNREGSTLGDIMEVPRPCSAE